MRKKKSFAVGLICISVSFILAFTLSLPTTREKRIIFDSSYGEEIVTLQGSYWEVPDAEYAVLICPGYSCDRQKWRPMADLLVANGYTTMSFDYSGQGASGGTIGFDNARTDNIPKEIDDAAELLHSISGIDYDHMILIGHSMGGRSILRLMYDYNSPEAVTETTKKDIGNIILMSAEVNYHYNAQASLFAGTSDDAEEPWHSYNPSYIEGTNVYIYGSTADDIVSDEDVLSVYARLGGQNVPESGEWASVQINELGSKITLGICGGTLHSYEMYSPKFAAYVNSALTDISGKTSTYPAWELSFVYLSWFFGLVGISLFLHAISHGSKWLAEDSYPVLEDSKKFLIWKAIMWVPGTIAALIICCLCVIMPFGSPVMNIPYMCFIAGYGIVMMFAYRKGKFKGTNGKLPPFSFKRKTGGKELAKCISVTAAVCFFVWFVLRATMYRLIPLNFRLFWVMFAAVIMAVGYYVSGCENDMLDKANASRKVRIIYNIIQYVPLFLLIAFYMALKSYSGMIGQVQNTVLMYVFCIPLGDYIKKKTGSRGVGAVVTAFLFQTLMITSAALISMF